MKKKVLNLQDKRNFFEYLDKKGEFEFYLFNRNQIKETILNLQRVRYNLCKLSEEKEYSELDKCVIEMNNVLDTLDGLSNILFDIERNTLPGEGIRVESEILLQTAFQLKVCCNLSPEQMRRHKKYFEEKQLPDVPFGAGNGWEIELEGVNAPVPCQDKPGFWHYIAFN